MVIIHMIWNAPFGLIPLPVVQDVKFVLLGIVGWIICFRLVQAGLRQLNKARQELQLPAIEETYSIEASPASELTSSTFVPPASSADSEAR